MALVLPAAMLCMDVRGDIIHRDPHVPKPSCMGAAHIHKGGGMRALIRAVLTRQRRRASLAAWMKRLPSKLCSIGCTGSKPLQKRAAAFEADHTAATQ